MSSVSVTIPSSELGHSALVAPGPAADQPDGDVRVQLLNAGELRTALADWQRLVQTALEPNVFFEPCLLLPALDHLAGGKSLEFLVLDAPVRGRPTDRVWCGFIPLARRRIRGLGLEVCRPWKHIHCYLGTPLVRREGAEQTMAALVAWLSEVNCGRNLWKLDALAGQGPCHQLLIQELNRQQLSSWVGQRHCRALFERQSTAEQFLQQAVPNKRRQEHRRQAKRLAEQGAVEFRALASGDDLEPWLADFMAVESSGWKGREGTALGIDDMNRAFFRAMAAAAHREGKLVMTSLVVGGRPIALNCKLTSGNGGFAFKTAYAEEFKNYSPGVLLETHNVALHHAQLGLQWIDSCAAPDHPMINSLWRGRRTIESLWIAGRSRTARTVLAGMPLAKELRRCLPRRSGSR